MNVATEIRNLPYSNVRELAIILDFSESWKNLMAIIPKKLERNKYECQVSRTNPCKYHSDHFKLLESGSIIMQKMCTELLFSEWGTSEKIRPTLGHLLHLLMKAQLYRAADYVAETLLKREPPARPMEGPAAVVTISMSDIQHTHNNQFFNEGAIIPDIAAIMQSDSDDSIPTESYLESAQF